MSNKILANGKRWSRFTSSKIYKLCKRGRGEFGFGAPALTYIEEKQIENRMQSVLETGAYSQAMAWGNFMELVVFSQIGLDYKIVANQTKVHPDKEFAPYWSGSCDLLVPEKKIGEIKCYQKKKFAQYTDCLLKRDVKLLKENFDEEYWQMVSNAILNEVDFAEAITFMPYESELEDIRYMAANYEGEDQWKYRFIAEKPSYELPLLKDGGYYKSVNKFEFQIPEEDIEFLKDRVRNAIILLERDESPK